MRLSDFICTGIGIRSPAKDWTYKTYRKHAVVCSPNEAVRIIGRGGGGVWIEYIDSDLGVGLTRNSMKVSFHSFMDESGAACVTASHADVASCRRCTSAFEQA